MKIVLLENRLNNSRYILELERVAKANIDWGKLINKTILITGATGMLGTYMIDLIMFRNNVCQQNTKLIALSRNGIRQKEQFAAYMNSEFFRAVVGDVNVPLELTEHCDYVIHAASNTHPLQYSADPIGTITTNIIGTKNVLDYAEKIAAERVAFLSSVEVYGENKGDTDTFAESYCGYIDCNTLRAGYPEGKRVGEALCQAYMENKGLDIVIPRLSRIYGSTMGKEDSKAIAQFIKKAVAGQDIVLKSEGKQLYSYCHVADAVIATLLILLEGKKGIAYNVAGDDSDLTLRQITEYLSGLANAKVIYELPDEKEAKGYSKASKATLNTERLKNLGWKSMFSMEQGLSSVYQILGAE